ncbi:LuxR family transcriptional regulator [Arenicella chitinivorans]|uniref:LuxR family transcriptional regulator n=1 Tax=Arenicella chitinivorans TaxID=1329800 RepID=A0A918VS65_9GAMM|nr:LuxR family transcriptional regulator [Arenicella chitinivorans]GHA17967.1 LuxR family transcriptional regulator [Arenicella chitinivorans]
MFIGRKTELSALMSIAQTLSDHRGAAVVLHGESGIGKTSLIQAFSRQMHGHANLIYCRCLDSIFSDELTPILSFARQRSRTIAKLIDDNTDVTRLFPALLQFFITRRRSTILIIEDAQWANGTMLSFLDYFGRRLVFSRCMLLVSYRSSSLAASDRLRQTLDAIPRNFSHDVELHPFTERELSHLAPACMDLKTLFNASSGNPLYIAQATQLNDPELSPNADIEDIIRLRIDRLNEQERHLLETLSIIPYPMTHSLVRALDKDQTAFTKLVDTAQGFLINDPTDRIIFQHELVRKIALAQVPDLRRVELHRNILQAHSATGETPNLVWKLMHTHGANHTKDVIHCAQELANQSSQLSAHSEAAAYLSVGLEYAYATDNETAAVLYESWAAESSFANQINEKVFDFRQHAINLWKALGRQDKVGENLYALSRAHWLSGNPARARLIADQAIEVLQGTDRADQVAKALSLKSQLSLLQSEYKDAIELGNTALALEARSRNHEVRAHALNNVGASLILSGDRSGQALLQQSLDLSLAHDLHEHIARGYVNFACVSILIKDYPTAERYISEGIAYGNRYENESKLGYLSGLLAQVRLEQGKLLDAKRVATGLLRSDEKAMVVLMPAENVLARVFALTAHESAEQKLKQVLAKALSIGEPQYIIAARFNLLEFAWLSDNSNLAAEQFEHLMELGPSKLENWRLGELDAWRARLGIGTTITHQTHVPAPYQLELSGDYRAAANAWKAHNTPLNQAICLMQDTSSSMNQSLVQAYQIVEACSATGLGNKLKAELKRRSLHGLLPKSKRGKSTDAEQHPLGLTRKEQQVLHQILEGRSNAEISANFSRSIRTIEAHVSSILSKFNAHNRLEVIIRTQNEPWLNPA